MKVQCLRAWARGNSAEHIYIHRLNRVYWRDLRAAPITRFTLTGRTLHARSPGVVVDPSTWHDNCFVGNTHIYVNG